MRPSRLLGNSDPLNTLSALLFMISLSSVNAVQPTQLGQVVGSSVGYSNPQEQHYLNTPT